MYPTVWKWRCWQTKPETTSDQRKLSQNAKIGPIKQGVKLALLQVFERDRVETPPTPVKINFAQKPLKIQCQILSSVLPRFWAKKTPEGVFSKDPRGQPISHHEQTTFPLTSWPSLYPFLPLCQLFSFWFWLNHRFDRRNVVFAVQKALQHIIVGQ